jgi:hypothetical protein
MSGSSIVGLPNAATPCTRHTWPGESLKSAAGRAQRASARNQNGTMSAPYPAVHNEIESTSFVQPISVDSDAFTMVVEEEQSLSRSNSSLNMHEGSSASASGRPRRKDKGKGKETETTIVRVKEEPKTITLHSPEPPVNLVSLMGSSFFFIHISPF